MVPSLTSFRSLLKGHILSEALNPLSLLHFPPLVFVPNHLLYFPFYLIHCFSPLLDDKLYESRDFCLLCSLLYSQHLRKHVLLSRCSANTCARKEKWVGPAFCTSPSSPSHAKSLGAC